MLDRIIDFLKKSPFKQLSIFQDVYKVWEKAGLDGKYLNTQLFCGGFDTEERYELQGNKKYSKTDITYHNNIHGFRLPKERYVYDKSKPEIACFGCSQTYGAGLPWEETWPAFLNEMLDNKFTIKNYGVCGASIDMVIRLVYNYIFQKNKPQFICCLLPDLYRKELYENDFHLDNFHLSNSLKQYCRITDKIENEQEKDIQKIAEKQTQALKFLNFNVLDWIAYKRLSNEKNLIYSFVKNIKFLELLSQCFNIPIYVFSFDYYLIDSIYVKKVVSPLCCVPTGEEYKKLKESGHNKARDNNHLGSIYTHTFASIFYRHIKNKI